MKSATRKYIKLSRNLAAKRTEGTVTEKEERRFMEDLERCWREMTEEEQDYVDQELAQDRL